MEQHKIQEIIDCLPKGRTKFHYFRDKYALMLLAHIVDEGTAIRDLKNGPYHRLLEKPAVKKVIQKTRGGLLSKYDLEALWPSQYHCYLLTIDKWGNKDRWSRFYNQTSRPGYNLVLQLNFSEEHNSMYNKFLKPGSRHPFLTFDHPVARNGRNTLAWARIDLDIDTGEALIEEIQTDWLRLAKKYGKKVAAAKVCSRCGKVHKPWFLKDDDKLFLHYIENTLKEHARIWDEAMLAASIWFLKEEIGIHRIYYHTFEFGCQLKNIDATRPPRSLYTTLPDKFCFKVTDEQPGFLVKKSNRKKMTLLKSANARFYRLML